MRKIRTKQWINKRTMVGTKEQCKWMADHHDLPQYGNQRTVYMVDEPSEKHIRAAALNDPDEPMYMFQLPKNIRRKSVSNMNHAA
jgi:hypothetical protein